MNSVIFSNIDYQKNASKVLGKNQDSTGKLLVKDMGSSKKEYGNYLESTKKVPEKVPRKYSESVRKVPPVISSCLIFFVDWLHG